MVFADEAAKPVEGAPVVVPATDMTADESYSRGYGHGYYYPRYHGGYYRRYGRSVEDQPDQDQEEHRRGYYGISISYILYKEKFLNLAT